MTAKQTRSIGSHIAHIVFVCVFAVANEASAITIRVPQDYAKITDALLWARNGDEIVVSPGTYVENIYFGGKNIVLRSTNPIIPSIVEATIIDGNQKGAVVTFAGTETSSCALSGFTIRNGSGGVFMATAQRHGLSATRSGAIGTAASAADSVTATARSRTT